VTQQQEPISVTVDVHAGEVMMIFNRPIQWAAFQAAAAREVARTLIEAADRVEQGVSKPN
jgi:hypothetical protein